MAAAVTACGGTQTAPQNSPQESAQEAKPLIDVRDDGGLTANFDNTAKDTMGGSGITIKEGEHLIIDSQLTAGKVGVRVTHGGSDINTVPTEDTSTMPTIDHEFEGVGETEYGMIEPGDYMVSVNVSEKATGEINFVIVSDDTEEAATEEASIEEASTEEASTEEVSTEESKKEPQT